jgi:hypothetical protein
VEIDAKIDPKLEGDPISRDDKFPQADRLQSTCIMTPNKKALAYILNLFSDYIFSETGSNANILR